MNLTGVTSGGLPAVHGLHAVVVEVTGGGDGGVLVGDADRSARAALHQRLALVGRHADDDLSRLTHLPPPHFWPSRSSGLSSSGASRVRPAGLASPPTG